MKLWPLIVSLLLAVPAWADISVTASVDQNRVPLGESVTFTISVSGTQGSPAPAIPRIDGLTFSGPSINTSVSIVNGTMSQSANLIYQITPTRAGEFTIPAIAVAVAGKSFETEPIKLTVLPSNTLPDQQQTVFIRVQLDSPQVYLGQTAPLNVILFARANIPLKNISNFTFDADGLGFKFLNNLKSGTKVVNGETFNIYVIEGAISPTRAGKLTFGPCVIKTHLATRRQTTGDWMQDQLNEMIGRGRVVEQPVTGAEVPIEVLPLPEQGRPADFAGAVGQWNLEVTAKPTEVAVGDPITLTVKITGNGNIDTVSTPALTGLDNFKTYDPTSKTTKNELSTTGERVFQQVLIPKSTDVKELPAVRLSYFDPVAKAYRTATQGPVKLQVKAGGPGAVVSGSTKARPAEKLGEDIVYLKGDLGPASSGVSWGAVWLLNITPVLALAGALGWKCRKDRLRGDVAYARRSRAARQARRMLERAGNLDEVLRALQSYLGDRLNIPASGITASVVDERQLPAGVREIFETCDAARFAGVPAEVAALKQKVEQVIDDLERNSL